MGDITLFIATCKKVFTSSHQGDMIAFVQVVLRYIEAHGLTLLVTGKSGPEDDAVQSSHSASAQSGFCSNIQ